jgi:hypothetical protein
MSSRNELSTQTPEALEQQIVAIILSLHLHLDSLEAAVAELHRNQQKTTDRRKRAR